MIEQQRQQYHLQTTFIYRPCSGDRVFAEHLDQSMIVIKWPSGCRHVIGGYLTIFPGGSQVWRASAREYLAAHVKHFHGVAWDEQGTLHVQSPQKVEPSEVYRVVRGAPIAGWQEAFRAEALAYKAGMPATWILDGVTLRPQLSAVTAPSTLQWTKYVHHDHEADLGSMRVRVWAVGINHPEIVGWKGQTDCDVTGGIGGIAPADDPYTMCAKALKTQIGYCWAESSVVTELKRYVELGEARWLARDADDELDSAINWYEAHRTEIVQVLENAGLLVPVTVPDVIKRLQSEEIGCCYNEQQLTEELNRFRALGEEGWLEQATSTEKEWFREHRDRVLAVLCATEPDVLIVKRRPRGDEEDDNE